MLLMGMFTVCTISDVSLVRYVGHGSIYSYTLSVANITCAQHCAQLSITACDDESGRSATEAEQRLA